MLLCTMGMGPGSMSDVRPSITVNGEAAVKVQPDKILMNLGIETRDNSITIAKQKNNDILAKAMAVIKESGIVESDVQTDNLSVEPRYADMQDRLSFLGYFVRNAFCVTIGDAAKVEGLMSRLLEAGVTHVHHVDFQTTEFKKYREEARELALKAAREKAEKMAAALGQSIGAPLQISEQGGGDYGRYYSGWSGWGYGGQRNMYQNVIQEIPEDSGGITDSFALGKISIRASVSVTFELAR